MKSSRHCDWRQQSSLMTWYVSFWISKSSHLFKYIWDWLHCENLELNNWIVWCINNYCQRGWIYGSNLTFWIKFLWSLCLSLNFEWFDWWMWMYLLDVYWSLTSIWKSLESLISRLNSVNHHFWKVVNLIIELLSLNLNLIWRLTTRMDFIGCWW